MKNGDFSLHSGDVILMQGRPTTKVWPPFQRWVETRGLHRVQKLNQKFFPDKAGSEYTQVMLFAGQVDGIPLCLSVTPPAIRFVLYSPRWMGFPTLRYSGSVMRNPVPSMFGACLPYLGMDGSVAWSSEVVRRILEGVYGVSFFDTVFQKTVPCHFLYSPLFRRVN